MSWDGLKHTQAMACYFKPPHSTLENSSRICSTVFCSTVFYLPWLGLLTSNPAGCSDDTAYKCMSDGFKVVESVMHITTDDNAFYTWPTLSAAPPKASVVRVPHEGGPGPTLTCFSDKL